MNRERQISNLTTAFHAILANKFRAILTALGIIFGVAAVIAMLAIGNGAKKELLEQVELIGLNNIEIKAKIPQTDEEKVSEKFSPGLNYNELFQFSKTLPQVKAFSPEIQIETTVMSYRQSKKSKVIGISSAYLTIKNLKLANGQIFSEKHFSEKSSVCIIGEQVQKLFFGANSAIGKQIKVKGAWFTVIGVLQPKNVTQAAQTNLGIDDINALVYVPYNTMLLRLINRNLVVKSQIEQASEESSESEEGEEKAAPPPTNYHQIDKAIIQVENADFLGDASLFIANYLKRRHNGVEDYEISVPQHLLEQQQKTKDVFNIVLGTIAGISLVVGGIGIMNIMLASVYERIKEIGLRLALGAYKSDIVQQFLYEAILICITGGLIGVILGTSVSFFISKFTDIETIISWSSIVISFVVAVLTGLIFGVAPARKASQQDPITSLRYE